MPQPTAPIQRTQSYFWISAWFFVTAFVIAWDVGYIFLRPRSMVGGDLHWIWKPYSLYAKVDYIYGLPSFERNDGFPAAQSAMNVVETIFNLFYLFKTHVSPSPAAPLIGFAGAIMTLSKTVLYWLQDYYCGWCTTKQNSLKDFILLWFIPNGFWILVPALIAIRLGSDISSSLRMSQVIGRAKGE